MVHSLLLSRSIHRCSFLRNDLLLFHCPPHRIYPLLPLLFIHEWKSIQLSCLPFSHSIHRRFLFQSFFSLFPSSHVLFCPFWPFVQHQRVLFIAVLHFTSPIFLHRNLFSLIFNSNKSEVLLTFISLPAHNRSPPTTTTRISIFSTPTLYRIRRIHAVTKEQYLRLISTPYLQRLSSSLSHQYPKHHHSLPLSKLSRCQARSTKRRPARSRNRRSSACTSRTATQAHNHARPSLTSSVATSCVRA